MATVPSWVKLELQYVQSCQCFFFIWFFGCMLHVNVPLVCSALLLRSQSLPPGSTPSLGLDAARRGRWKRTSMPSAISHLWQMDESACGTVVLVGRNPTSISFHSIHNNVFRIFFSVSHFLSFFLAFFSFAFLAVDYNQSELPPMAAHAIASALMPCLLTHSICQYFDILSGGVL